MKIRRATADDIFAVLESDSMIAPYMTREQAEASANAPHTWTGEIDGRVMFVCGALVYWRGRAEVWSLVSKDSGPHMVSVTRAIRKLIGTLEEIKRLEFMVETHFVSGHRWAGILGFEAEAPRLKSYFPNGKDATLYARVN